jgi:hypothetical protein
MALLIALLLSLGSSGSLFAEEGRVYVIRPGDTLWSIAMRFGTSVHALVQANGVENPNMIYVGQSLALPGNAQSAPPPQASAPSPAPAPQSTHSATALLSRQRLITYYGNPWAAQMGILGELSPEALVSELHRVAQLFQPLSDKPVQPAIHLIVTVAQASAGADGLYRLRMPASVIEQYIDLAERNNMPIFLDVQVGRSTVAAEVAAIRQYLTKPHVHLALDPEFDMWGNQRPGVELGHMTAEEINHAIGVLADVVAANQLPNKVLIVHQFTASMINGKRAIQNHPSVDIVIDMDGFGGQGAKIAHYNAYVRDEPVEYAGIKLFYRHDVDLMSPAQVMRLTPLPDVVIYQ